MARRRRQSRPPAAQTPRKQAKKAPRKKRTTNARPKIHDAFAQQGKTVMHDLPGSFVIVDSTTRLNTTEFFPNDGTYNWDIAYMIVVSNPTSAVAYLLYKNGTNADSWAWFHAKSEHLQNSPPVSMRPMRLSVRIRNLTKADNIEGVVRCVKLKSAITIDGERATMTGAYNTVQALETIFAAHTGVQTWTSQECANGTKQLDANPCHWVPYADYDIFQSITYDPDGRRDGGNTANTAMTTAAAKLPLETLVFQFPYKGPGPADINNSFDITIQRQDACTFTPGTLLNSQQRPSPLHPAPTTPARPPRPAIAT
jgi:hypothetical protein